MSVRPVELFAYEGQSLALGPTEAEAYPAIVEAARPGILHVVRAVGATTWDMRSAWAPETTDVLLGGVTGRATLIDCGGTFEINLGQTAAGILADAEAYWTARLAAGWDRIIALTVPDSIGFDAAEDTVRADLNTLIRASSLLDGVADIAANAAFQDATNVTYFSDGTHFTAAAAALAGAIILTKV